jgi:peroxiredoxin
VSQVHSHVSCYVNQCRGYDHMLIVNTATCSETHVPGFIEKLSEIKSKGVDEVLIYSITDAFVMNGWSRVVGGADKGIKFVGDANGELATQLGLTQDLSSMGFGKLRSKRFALVIDNLVIKYVGVESGPDVTASSAEAVLKNL